MIVKITAQCQSCKKSDASKIGVSNLDKILNPKGFNLALAEKLAKDSSNHWKICSECASKECEGIKKWLVLKDYKPTIVDTEKEGAI